VNWLQRLLRGDRLEHELDAELRDHLERQVEDYVRAGMAPDEARRRAHLLFGGLEQTKEACRDARGTRWLHDLAADLRFASRLLSKEKGLTAVAVIALALGIGVNNTFFTVVNAVCLRGLPIDEADRVVYVSSTDARGQEHGLSYLDFVETRSRLVAVSGLAAFATGPIVLGDDDRAPDRVFGAYVSANTFDLLRETPVAGRSLLPEDDNPGAPAVVILGYRVWKTRYHSDPGVIGETVRVDGMPATVIGVMGEGFRFPNNADVWRPLASMAGLPEQARDVRSLMVFGRLRAGATVLDARTELRGIASDLSRDYPETNRSVEAKVGPLNERYSSRITDPVWLAFMTAGALVLLIACANVANLLLMRATYRTREIAIRVSLGATRRRIVRQLLVESSLLAGLGGVAGLGVSVVGTRLLSTTLTENAPYWLQFTMDGRVFVVLAAVCAMSVVVFGLAPALHASRSDTTELLHEDGRSSSGGLRARRWTALFLTAEFALTMVLLAAVAQGYRTFNAALADELVIDSPDLLTLWVTLPADRYGTPEQRLAVFDRALERLRGSGLVSSVAMTTALPGRGAEQRPLFVEGRDVAADSVPHVSSLAVSPGYLETIAAPIVRGRTLDEQDGLPGRDTVIVNERFARMYFPDDDPIGHRIRLGEPNDASATMWRTIVGVAPTIRQQSQGTEPDPVVYLPLRTAAPDTAALMVRARADAGALATQIRHEFRALDADLPLYSVMTMEQVVSASRMNGRVSQVLVTVIGCIALLLSIVGLHAVTGHAVAQRTREIGIRIALGARARQVEALVLRRALTQLGIGLLAGVACTFLWEYLFGDPGQATRTTDPLLLASVAVVVALVALAACLRPARRASGLNPIAALRQ
jgi:putative ABC transport system permease protein